MVSQAYVEYAAKSEATAIEEADEGTEGTDGGVAARAGVEGLHEVLSLFYREGGQRAGGTVAVPPPPPQQAVQSRLACDSASGVFHAGAAARPVLMPYR